jgi:hypothetical protein
MSVGTILEDYLTMVKSKECKGNMPFKTKRCCQTKCSTVIVVNFITLGLLRLAWKEQNVKLKTVSRAGESVYLMMNQENWPD